MAEAAGLKTVGGAGAMLPVHYVRNLRPRTAASAASPCHLYSSGRHGLAAPTAMWYIDQLRFAQCGTDVRPALMGCVSARQLRCTRFMQFIFFLSNCSSPAAGSIGRVIPPVSARSMRHVQGSCEQR
jgi:hypothetical protein